MSSASLLYVSRSFDRFVVINRTVWIQSDEISPRHRSYQKQSKYVAKFPNCILILFIPLFMAFLRGFRLRKNRVFRTGAPIYVYTRYIIINYNGECEIIWHVEFHKYALKYYLKFRREYELKLKKYAQKKKKKYSTLVWKLIAVVWLKFIDKIIPSK